MLYVFDTCFIHSVKQQLQHHSTDYLDFSWDLMVLLFLLLLLLLLLLLSTHRVRGGAEAVQGRKEEHGPERCLDRKEPRGDGDRHSGVQNKPFPRTLSNMKKSRSAQGVTPADVSPVFIYHSCFPLSMNLLLIKLFSLVNRPLGGESSDCFLFKCSHVPSVKPSRHFPPSLLQNVLCHCDLQRPLLLILSLCM